MSDTSEEIGISSKASTSIPKNANAENVQSITGQFCCKIDADTSLS